MNQNPQIRRTPDGSIDRKYYLEKGRDCRSHAARDLVARAYFAISRGLAKTANAPDGIVVGHRNPVT
jgi:hypothetical protein